MLEQPGLSHDAITRCMQLHFGVQIVHVEFLPLGDVDSAHYRLIANDESAYFLKLRRRGFHDISVTLPRFLHERGIAQIIAPMVARSGGVQAKVAEFTGALYPFVEGRNGYQVVLSPRQWTDFGRAMKRVHTLEVPAALREQIPRETFSPQWREAVSAYLDRRDLGDDPTAVELTAWLQRRRGAILDLVERASHLAKTQQMRSPEFVVCHADAHAGNVLIGRDDALYIVDWDTPILAPKERDLMYVGGAQGFVGRTAREEEMLFYRGYGPAQIDAEALAYYRCERIVEDIAVNCAQLLSGKLGDEDQAQVLRNQEANFLPNGTLEMAYRSPLNPDVR